MDSVITHVIGIHRKKTRKISGDTGKYYAQLAQDEETYEKTRQNDERKRKEIELFISKFRAKAQWFACRSGLTPQNGEAGSPEIGFLILLQTFSREIHAQRERPLLFL
jgi:hypothetical protein